MCPDPKWLLSRLYLRSKSQWESWEWRRRSCLRFEGFFEVSHRLHHLRLTLPEPPIFAPPKPLLIFILSCSSLPVDLVKHLVQWSILWELIGILSFDNYPMLAVYWRLRARKTPQLLSLHGRQRPRTSIHLDSVSFLRLMRPPSSYASLACSPRYSSIKGYLPRLRRLPSNPSQFSAHLDSAPFFVVQK